MKNGLIIYKEYKTHFTSYSTGFFLSDNAINTHVLSFRSKRSDWLIPQPQVVFAKKDEEFTPVFVRQHR